MITVSLIEEEALHLELLLYHEWTSRAESKRGQPLEVKRVIDQKVKLERGIIHKIIEARSALEGENHE